VGIVSEIIKYQAIAAGFVTGGPKCYCGNRDWFPKGEKTWKCSNCDRIRTAQHRGIIINGPKCYCGNKDWFVGGAGARCSDCDRWRETEGGVLGYIVGGPECYCGSKDWIVGNSVYRCTNCDRER